MQSFYLLSSFILFSIGALGQQNFVTASIVNLSGDTTRGQINDQLWIANPDHIEFKNLEGSTTHFYPTELKAFVVGNRMYRSYQVSLDSASAKTDALSTNPYPAYKVLTLFLKVIIDSRSSLLEYRGADDRSHYFIEEKGKAEELINHPYLIIRAGIISLPVNRSFISQLQQRFSDCARVKIGANQSYSKNALKKLFIEYNTCTNAAHVGDVDHVFKSKKSWGIITNLGYEHYRKGFEGKPGFGLGAYFNFAPSHRQYKTTYFAELALHKFPNQKIKNGATYEAFKSQSFKLAFGMRNRFDHSKHQSFISFGGALSFGLKDEYRVGSSLLADNFWPMGALFAGAGTMIGKTILDLRYERGSGVSFGPDQKMNFQTMATGYSSINLTASFKLYK